jgi:hypothetical protein
MAPSRSVLTGPLLALISCSLWLFAPSCGGGDGSSVTGPSDSSGSSGSSGSSSGPLVIDLSRTSITGTEGNTGDRYGTYHTYTVTVGLRAVNDVNVRYLDLTLYSDQEHTAQIISFRIAGSEMLSQVHLDSGRSYQTTAATKIDSDPTHLYAVTAKLEVAYADNAGREGYSVSAFTTVAPLPPQ